MYIAYTMTEGRGELDKVLSDFATSLAQSGIRARGVVQTNTDREKCHRCDMDVQVLPDGPVIRISQFLGKEATGCRLDPSALEGAVAAVEHSMEGNFDVLVINKFGKHEASGQGFRTLIGEALARDIPVIVGTNTMNRDAFQDFAGGLAEFVAPETEALTNWLKAGMNQS